MHTNKLVQEPFIKEELSKKIALGLNENIITDLQGFI